MQGYIEGNEMRKLKLAVIGKDVSKSSSPEMHSFIAENMGNEISYEKVSIPESEFDMRIDGLFERFDGFNVTIPFKLSVIPYLKKFEGDARTFGAVNTVRSADKSGYNTDGAGFALMLKNNGVCAEGKRALVLGAGGAGRSVAKKLADAGAEVYVYDTRIENANAVAAEFCGVKAVETLGLVPYGIIVNATGIGMHKTEGVSPVGEELLRLCEVAVDLIYTPKKSEFLKIAEGAGKKIINGEGMLFYQAYYAQCLYFGSEPNEMQAKKLFEKYQEKNL